MEGPTIMEALDGETSWRETRNVPTGANIMIRTMPPPGAGPAEGPAADQARTRRFKAEFLRHVLLYTLTAPSGTEVKWDVIGEAEAPDGQAWILDAAGPDKFALRIFIDQQTYLPLMATWRGLQAPRPMMRAFRGPAGHEGKGGPGERKMEPPPGSMPAPKDVEFEARMGEYTKYGGIMLPKVMTLNSEGKVIEEFELKNVKVNPALKAEKFRK
jgi:hypothetical protein